jgi:hypothetical protein
MTIAGLGISFGTRYLISRLNGDDRRTATRKSGVSAITETALPDAGDVANQVSALVEEIAIGEKEADPQAFMPDINKVAIGRVAAALETEDEEKYAQVEQELQQYADELSDAAAILRSHRRRTRENKLDNLRRKNLDK